MTLPPVALTALGAAFFLALAGTPVVRAAALRLNIVDKPNHRSSHERPTARAGGVAILAAIAVSLLLTSQLTALGAYFLIGAALIAVIGLIDDVVGLRARSRLLIQIAAAVAAVVGGLVVRSLDLAMLGSIGLGVIAIPLTIFWIVGVTNAYNFMDGINGIASLQAIAAGCGLAILLARHGDVAGAAAGLAIAGAAGGFLPWNFPKASIFMGDVASGTLGFMLSALIVRACTAGATFIEAAIVLLPFCLDAGVTLLRRIAKGEAFFEAHRSHFYQRLNRLGWSHARVSLLWFALALACAAGAAAYASLSGAAQLVMLCALLLLHVAVAVLITRAEQRGAATP